MASYCLARVGEDQWEDDVADAAGEPDGEEEECEAAGELPGWDLSAEGH